MKPLHGGKNKQTLQVLQMYILHFRRKNLKKGQATDELGIFTLKAAMRLLSSFQPQNTAVTSSDLLSSVKVFSRAFGNGYLRRGRTQSAWHLVSRTLEV